MIEVVPWRSDVHQRAMIFCRHFLVGELDRKLLTQAWVAIEGPRTLGVTGIQTRIDVPVFCAIDELREDECNGDFSPTNGQRPRGKLCT